MYISAYGSADEFSADHVFMSNLNNKKVLLMGLGILGGGVATARFLVEKGAILTVTDMKDEKFLAPSIAKLTDLKHRITFVLGEHREQDFLDNEIIVINPDVSIANKFVQFAIKNGKQIENELTLFYEFCPSRKIVAVTGTRGKTTTTNWVSYFLSQHDSNTVLAGNSTDNPFLASILKCDDNSFVAMEVPSYQLELLGEKNDLYAPRVALITNIYQDHLARHGSMEEYTKTKANIFKSQSNSDTLILNKDNKWTKFLLGLKPESKVEFFSKDMTFDYLDRASFVEKWGEHNLLNLYAAILAVKTMGVDIETIKKSIPNLPQIKFREEKLFDDGKLQIYNDTAATSPEATVAALERFDPQNSNVLLISGGTDRELEFNDWAKIVGEKLNPENLILLSGSATEKMKKALNWTKYNEFETLDECLKAAQKRAAELKSGTKILFSPSSKSFEKFKNEYDRGEKFNELVGQIK